MTPIPLSKYRALVSENVREADALVAEHVCGWNWFSETHKEHGEVFQLIDRQSHPLLTRADALEVELYKGKKKIWHYDIPEYHSDLNACAQMEIQMPRHEDEVSVNELRWAYLKALGKVTEAEHHEDCEGHNSIGLSRLIMATPTQKCEAALLAVGAVVGEEKR